MDGPDIQIIEYDLGPIKGVRGQPGKPLSANMGVSVRDGAEVRKEWLRPGRDNAPGTKHTLARIGAKFWNAGNETFRVGSVWVRPEAYKVWSQGGPRWAVALTGIWRFELLAGNERDSQFVQDVQAIITPTNDAFGNPPPSPSWFDWQLPPAYAAEANGEEYIVGMVMDITDIPNNLAPGDPPYWLKMTFDPNNWWGQTKSIEFRVRKGEQEFLPLT